MNLRWSPNADACVKCGRSNVKHKGYDMCETCLKRTRYNEKNTRGLAGANVRIKPWGLSGIRVREPYILDGEPVIDVRLESGTRLDAVPCSIVEGVVGY